MTDPREIKLETTDAWLEEVRGYLETQRRPDADKAFAERLNLRVGGERTFEATIDYLTSALYNAIRYTTVIVDQNYGRDAAIPQLRYSKAGPTRNAGPRGIRHKKALRGKTGLVEAVEETFVVSRKNVIRDKDGRIEAIEEAFPSIAT